MTHSKMLTTKEAADILGVSPSVMEKWRRRGLGPKYFKYEHSIRYNDADLRDYMQAAQTETNSLVLADPVGEKERS